LALSRTCTHLGCTAPWVEKELKERYSHRLPAARPAATFVGSNKYMDCHKAEYDHWQNSHHDRAMDVAKDETVLGNSNNAVLKFHGITSRFYRKDKKFLNGIGYNFFVFCTFSRRYHYSCPIPTSR
jgi:hypothetical protein